MWAAEKTSSDAIVDTERDHEQNAKFNKKLQPCWKLRFLSLISHRSIYPLLASSPCIEFLLNNRFQRNRQLPPQSSHLLLSSPNIPISSFDRVREPPRAHAYIRSTFTNTSLKPMKSSTRVADPNNSSKDSTNPKTSQKTNKSDKSDKNDPLLSHTDSPSPPIEEQTTDIDDKKPIFIDTTDSQAVHVTLDEQIEEFFKTIPNIKQDQALSNIVLFLSILSILVCAGVHGVEHYYKLPPNNQYLVPSLIAFFLLQGILYYKAYVSSGLVYQSQNFKLNGKLRKVNVYTAHKLFSADYRITLNYISLGKQATISVEETFQVTSFFNTQGRFLRTAFDEALQGMWAKAISQENKKQE